jgi:hypothetical protein
VTVKKFAAILLAAMAAVAVVLVPSVAFANMGPHGGYITDTEACAGCHRAHTAPSSITWVDGNNASKSALLLSDSSQVYQFCLACHDSTSQGADTNVLDGVYEGTSYGTNGATLLGGAFGREDASLPGGHTYDGSNHAVTSTHLTNGGSWGAWGGGAFGSTSSVDATGNSVLQGSGNKIVMDCGSCHDPHGSSNYRILKDMVNGVRVGGYDPTAPGASATTPTPTPFVSSNETGYPSPGFALHSSNAGYQPNYTTPKYAIPSDPTKGMSGWCAGCHTVYTATSSKYNAADGLGYVMRYRHPVNVPVSNVAGSNYAGARSLVVTGSVLPLDHPAGSTTNKDGDWIECLTCHNAHGASTVMAGYANVADPANDLTPNNGLGGVPPVGDSALLKLDNRAVCEACHNK